MEMQCPKCGNWVKCKKVETLAKSHMKSRE